MKKMNKETARWVVDWIRSHPNQDIPYPVARRIKAAYNVMGDNAPKFLEFAYKGREALCGEINLDSIVMTAIRWYAAFYGNLNRAQEWAQVCFDAEAAAELYRSGVTPAEAGVIVDGVTIGCLVANCDWSSEQAIEFLNSRDQDHAKRQAVQQDYPIVVTSGCLGFRLL